ARDKTRYDSDPHCGGCPVLTAHRRAAAALLAALALALPAAAQPPPHSYSAPGPPPSRFQQPPQQTQGSAQAAVPAGAYTGPAMFPPRAPASGGFNPWGWGWGASNPYEGYLNGAANVTLANAQYQMITQQARLVREQGRQSELDTRKKTIQERQWELAQMPDPEEERQKDLYRALNRARNNPPAVEIWSGDALNSILTALQSVQSRGVRGPLVPLSPDMLRHINVTTGVTRGSTGLLRDGGKLSWPFVLRQPMFDDNRTAITKPLTEAVRQAPSGEVSVTTLNKLDEALRQFQTDVDARIADLTPDQYVQAARYLRELRGGFNVLKQSDVARYFSPNATAQGNNVSELVAHMTANGLRFAPAVSGDETYYTALYQAMVTYDNGIAQLVTRPGPPPGGPTGPR
ncbi:MAG TPA: hypothetical protein VFE78_02850, partial [Gemmataceae bacterium]|nr:hypothetical protein [Gemmataceae bacterium]